MSRNSGLVVPLILLNSQGGGGGGGTTSLSNGGTGSSLADPGADRIMFWDESGNAVDWLSVGSGLSISGTTLSATGLTQFTAEESTSSPNATVYVDSLTAAAASTNADFAVIPKGTGAFLTQVPDSTTTGGNKRGTYATDFQRVRNAASQVASGSQSTILAGQWNTASGTGSMAGGTSCVASGIYSVALGYYANATAAYSTAFGYICAASAQAAFAANYQTVASGSGSSAFGTQSTTRGLTDVQALGTNIRSAQGDRQHLRVVQAVTTTDATTTTLTVAGAAVSSSNVLVMPNNSAAHVATRVVAMTASAAIVGSWKVEATFKRVANAASTALVGATTITTFGQDAGFATCVVDLAADTTQGAPVVRVTGVAATTIYWVAHTEMVQVA